MNGVNIFAIVSNFYINNFFFFWCCVITTYAYDMYKFNVFLYHNFMVFFIIFYVLEYYWVLLPWILCQSTTTGLGDVTVGWNDFLCSENGFLSRNSLESYIFRNLSNFRVLQRSLKITVAQSPKKEQKTFIPSHCESLLLLSLCF